MTVDEIAKRANVSKATVSRVINESGYVSKEKREFGGYIQLEWWYQR